MFENERFDPDRLKKDMRNISGPQRRYVIYFTPRSGSSWLSSVLGSTNVLGDPQEWFNPNFIEDIASAINADNLENYLKMLVRKQKSREGVFGLEITYFQMQEISSKELFERWFVGDYPAFFLYRENIVAQAISLYKATKTNHFHTVKSTEEDVAKSDGEIQYNGPEIKNWLEHIKRQELGLIHHFDEHDLKPKCMSYERMFAAGTKEVISSFSSVILDGHQREYSLPQSSHRKIGTSKNREMEMMFLSENADYIKGVDHERSRIFDLAAANSLL